MGRTLSPKQTALLLDPKPSLLQTDEINPASYGSPKSKGAPGYMDKFSKTDATAMAQIAK